MCLADVCRQAVGGEMCGKKNAITTTLNHPQTPNPQHNPHTPTSQTSPGRKTGVLHRGILFRAPYKIDSTNYAGLPLGTLVFKTIII